MADQEGLNAVGTLRDCLAAGVVAIDSQSKVTSFNAAAEKLCGLPASRSVGQSIDLLPYPLRTLLRQTLHTGIPVPDAPLDLPDASGHTLNLRVTTAPIEFQSGQPPAGAVAVLHDITPAKHLEQGLGQLGVATFSGEMAHALKNAMVMIKTYVDLLLEKNQDADLASIVSRELSRMDFIVSQMLHFATPRQLVFSNIRVHEVLDQALRRIAHHLDAHKIVLQCSLAAPSDLVNGNAQNLEQAFINLLFNAIEAMGASGRLTVATDIGSPDQTSAALVMKESPSQLRVTIRDTGVGIPQEDLSRVFEPSFTTKPDGTGLGLSITRRIVQEHHGTIEVQSERDEGTAFIITLPLARKQF